MEIDREKLFDLKVIIFDSLDFKNQKDIRVRDGIFPDLDKSRSVFFALNDKIPGFTNLIENDF